MKEKITFEDFCIGVSSFFWLDLIILIMFSFVAIAQKGGFWLGVAIGSSLVGLLYYILFFFWETKYYGLKLKYSLLKDELTYFKRRLESAKKNRNESNKT
jgi:hypothetical protein